VPAHEPAPMRPHEHAVEASAIPDRRPAPRKPAPAAEPTAARRGRAPVGNDRVVDVSTSACVSGYRWATCMPPGRPHLQRARATSARESGASPTQRPIGALNAPPESASGGALTRLAHRRREPRRNHTQAVALRLSSAALERSNMAIPRPRPESAGDGQACCARAAL